MMSAGNSRRTLPGFRLDGPISPLDHAVPEDVDPVRHDAGHARALLTEAIDVELARLSTD